jgi:hypothetical protein
VEDDPEDAGGGVPETEDSIMDESDDEEDEVGGMLEAGEEED